MALESLPQGGREPGGFPEAESAKAREKKKKSLGKDRTRVPRAPPATHRKKIKLIKVKLKHYV